MANLMLSLRPASWAWLAVARDGQHLSADLAAPSPKGAPPPLSRDGERAETARAPPTRWGHTSFWLACIPGLAVVLLAPSVVRLKSEYLVYPIEDAAAAMGVVALCFGAGLVAIAQTLMSVSTLEQEDRVAAADLLVGIVAACFPLVLEVAGVSLQASDLWQIWPGSCVLSPVTYQHILTMGLASFVAVGNAIRSKFDDVGGTPWQRVRRLFVPATFAVATWPALLTPYLIATWPATVVGMSMFSFLVIAAAVSMFIISRDLCRRNGVTSTPRWERSSTCSVHSCCSACSRRDAKRSRRVRFGTVLPAQERNQALDTAGAVAKSASLHGDDDSNASLSLELSTAEMVERITPLVVLLVILANTIVVVLSQLQTKGCPAAFSDPSAPFPAGRFPAGYAPNMYGEASLRSVTTTNFVMLFTGGACLVLAAVMVVARAQESAAEARERISSLAADRLRQALRVLGHETRGPTNGAVLALSLLERSVRSRRLAEAEELLGDLRVSLERTKRGLDALLALQSAEEDSAATDTRWEWGCAHASAARQVRAALRGACEAEGVTLSVEVTEPHSMHAPSMCSVPGTASVGAGAAWADHTEAACVQPSRPAGHDGGVFVGGLGEVGQTWEVFTDADKIAAICINFVSNALKHAPQEGGVIRLRVGLVLTDCDEAFVAAEYPDCRVPDIALGRLGYGAGVSPANLRVVGTSSAEAGARDRDGGGAVRRRPSGGIHLSHTNSLSDAGLGSGRSGEGSLSGFTKDDDGVMPSFRVGDESLVQASLVPARPAPEHDSEASVRAREAARGGGAAVSLLAGGARGSAGGGARRTSRLTSERPTEEHMVITPAATRPIMDSAAKTQSTSPTGSGRITQPSQEANRAPSVPPATLGVSTSEGAGGGRVPLRPLAQQATARPASASHLSPPPEVDELTTKHSGSVQGNTASQPGPSRPSQFDASTASASATPQSCATTAAAGRGGSPDGVASPPPVARCMLVIEALDNGRGMPDSVMRSGKLFVPFARLQQGDGQLRMASTGLGLSIVKSIAVRDMAGSVGVATKEGEGACFFALVPCFGRRRARQPSMPVAEPGAWGLPSVAASSVASSHASRCTERDRCNSDARGSQSATAAGSRRSRADREARRRQRAQARASSCTTAGRARAHEKCAYHGSAPSQSSPLVAAQRGRRGQDATAPPCSGGTLPLARARIRPGATAGSGPLAYVVDDDGIGRHLTARVVRSMGFRSETFCDGLPFVARLRALADEERAAASAASSAPRPEWPVVVCLDSNMPEMGGASALAELRRVAAEMRSDGLVAAAARLASLPVVGITGDAHDDDKAKFVRQGATMVLTKPVEATAVQEALTAVLGDKMPTRRA